MNKPLVIGNWKMNGSRQTMGQLLQAIADLGRDERLEVVICPPFVYLDAAAGRAVTAGLGLGAQHVSEYAQGAYTGEVGASMLIDVGCKYVLVGHSERRALFGESDARVARQLDQALSAGLIPVLCIGEDARQRGAGDTWAVLRRQLSALEQLPDPGRAGAVADMVIAYEPTWAIGTGRAADASDVQEVHSRVREMLGERGLQMRILYGGSVSVDNAGELMMQPDIDGLLVGGASLRAAEFAQICDLAAASWKH